MSNALQVSGLCKTYDDFKLDNVSFSLPAGYIMGFVGQNGAGKTTTIRCILNMARRESGEIRIFERDNRIEELAIKQELGAVFDEIFFVDVWRVKEVEKAIKGFYSQWDSKLFADFLSRFDLPPNKQVKDLSRGMKMKLMLAVAMSHGAKLLLLDEPTSGLDPVAREELLDILWDYIADGEKSVFFSTHITTDLESIADFITLIDHGKILYTGSTDALLEHFVIVKGGIPDLTDQLRSTLIGVSTSLTGFSGMATASEIKELPSGMSIQEPTIDEILVHISKAAKHE